MDSYKVGAPGKCHPEQAKNIISRPRALSRSLQAPPPAVTVPSVHLPRNAAERGVCSVLRLRDAPTPSNPAAVHRPRSGVSHAVKAPGSPASGDLSSQVGGVTHKAAKNTLGLGSGGRPHAFPMAEGSRLGAELRGRWAQGHSASVVTASFPKWLHQSELTPAACEVSGNPTPSCHTGS